MTLGVGCNSEKYTPLTSIEVKNNEPAILGRKEYLPRSRIE